MCFILPQGRVRGASVKLVASEVKSKAEVEKEFLERCREVIWSCGSKGVKREKTVEQKVKEKNGHVLEVRLGALLN